MISVDAITDKVKRFFDKEGVPPIVQDGKKYHILGKYTIIEKEDYYEIYKYEQYVDTVNASSTALSWCIFDSKNNWKSANSLLVNDKRIQDYRFQIANRKRILKTVTNDDDKELLLIRINDDIGKLQKAKINLNKTVKLTKYIKIKGFNDESK